MAKYEIHNAHINHQHIEKDTPMEKELLQSLTNIIEGNLVNIAGALMVLPVPHSAINAEMHIYLDKAMYALLEVKRELGLTSQLKEASHPKNSHDDDVRDELARQLRNERGTDEQ